ncbi:unnamed protein product [Ectocarpus sp. 13 AM-2016]
MYRKRPRDEWHTRTHQTDFESCTATQPRCLPTRENGGFASISSRDFRGIIGLFPRSWWSSQALVIDLGGAPSLRLLRQVDIVVLFCVSSLSCLLASKKRARLVFQPNNPNALNFWSQNGFKTSHHVKNFLQLCPRLIYFLRRVIQHRLLRMV